MSLTMANEHRFKTCWRAHSAGARGWDCTSPKQVVYYYDDKWWAACQPWLGRWRWLISWGSEAARQLAEGRAASYDDAIAAIEQQRALRNLPLHHNDKLAVLP